jgi:serine/threonine protein kinase
MSRKIPEHFIWHIFHGVSLALRGLYKALDDEEDEEDEKDSLGFMVHQDIKPNNIFLRDTEGDRYPRPVLGDFDASMLLKDMTDRRTGGTEGYIAPVSTAHASVRSAYKEW